MQSLKKNLVMMSLAALSLPVFAKGIPVQLYKNPQCLCCNAYGEHLEANGFEVEFINTRNMTEVKQKHDIPERLEGCHTALIKGYVFEGLVPAEYVMTVVEEGRPVRGLSVPGMPTGAPGMEGNKKQPINVYYLQSSPTPQVFATF
jgi:hypothetical protein